MSGCISWPARTRRVGNRGGFRGRTFVCLESRRARYPPYERLTTGRPPRGWRLLAVAARGEREPVWPSSRDTTGCRPMRPWHGCALPIGATRSKPPGNAGSCARRNYRSDPQTIVCGPSRGELVRGCRKRLPNRNRLQVVGVSVPVFGGAQFRVVGLRGVAGCDLNRLLVECLSQLRGAEYFRAGAELPERPFGVS